MNLQLEYRDKFDGGISTYTDGRITALITPVIGEDYWVFRIKLFKDQALLAFPKFRTLGIGFALEEDWNTNLIYLATPRTIFNHIKCNKKYKEITDQECIAAIKVLQKACRYYKDELNFEVGDMEMFFEHLEKLKRINVVNPH
jgi:hypothetical protein